MENHIHIMPLLSEQLRMTKPRGTRNHRWLARLSRERVWRRERLSLALCIAINSNGEGHSHAVDQTSESYFS